MADKSNLSKTAKEVNPLLKIIYSKMREAPNEKQEMYEEMIENFEEIDEVSEEFEHPSLVDLANEIIRKEADDSEKMDFMTLLRQIRSEILLNPDLTERQKTIISNFTEKVIALVTEV